MPTSKTTIFVYCTTFENLVYFTIDLLLIRKATLAQWHSLDCYPTMLFSIQCSTILISIILYFQMLIIDLDTLIINNIPFFSLALGSIGHSWSGGKIFF